MLAGADSAGFDSVRDKPISRAERTKLGRSLRHQVPRAALADWTPASDRIDPVLQVELSQQGRQDWLIPIRIGRMTATPYGFFRGSAGLMAADVAALPATGIMPVVCGDAHLGNFGFYASPERALVIDCNDFDEAHPGCWEWDLRRLVASVHLAGRQNNATEEQCSAAVRACSRAYRAEVRALARQPLLYRSFNRLDVDQLTESTADETLRAEIVRASGRARRKTSDRALPRFTTTHHGRRRIVEEPPLITRITGKQAEALAVALDEYLQTLAPHWRRVVAGYTLVDLAHKVVGVGSVGLRAYVALLEGSSPDDVLFLQLKEANRSVLARFVHGNAAWHPHQGQRVVEYQQALQTVSDPLLGWTSVGDRQFYVRQFRDMKGAVTLESIDAAALADYAGILGHLLAKGHARTSGASMIAGYVGTSDNLDLAFAGFATAYADQAEADHALLIEAVKRGRLPAEYGI